MTSTSSNSSLYSGWLPMITSVATMKTESLLRTCNVVLKKLMSTRFRGETSWAMLLCFAVQEDALHVVELLLKAGADAAAQCNDQQLVHPRNSVAVNSYQIPHTSRQFSGYTPLPQQHRL
jgi:hypothetical protein